MGASTSTRLVDRTEASHHRLAGGNITLRRLPYPYCAALAICSDLDETPDRHVYYEIVRFLNTTENTAMGPGVGLEVGNSIYFDMPPNQFAYWNTDDAGREMVRALIRSGHIDCLHSYGDWATSRAHAGQALEELSRHDCRLEVWIDHSRAPSNFGADIMRGQGDVVGSQAYHADLTHQFGLKYVWRGRVTSVIGQDTAPGLDGLFRGRRPVASARTLAKEAAKQILSAVGNGKYAMHRPNRVLRQSTLRDGRPVYEFLRSNPHWRGVGEGATAAGISEVLSDDFLDKLIAKGGACVLYTHLGKVRDPRRPFGPATVTALRRLASACTRGDIFVTTTNRLLRFLAARDALQYTVEQDGASVLIHLGELDDPVSGCRLPALDELQGLSFVLPRRAPVELRLRDGSRVPCELVHAEQHTYVSVPWQPLALPDLSGTRGRAVALHAART
jgi:hypothetical protein